ncbi:hypothetical protein ABZV58_31155 [Nocardia sp. NPDC004654]|uniref:hypothetical protein n=1 Tax=Nocardia sp. NPDC004654 TaxID=3154776 RepID=UPI0033B54673
MHSINHRLTPVGQTGSRVDMAVRIVDDSLMLSDETAHQARSVSTGGWVVSYLPGRTVSIDQALAALRAAEELTVVRACAASLGLTVLEIAGMAAAECPWPPPPSEGFGRRLAFWLGVSR